jgi:hypothetical protein
VDTAGPYVIEDVSISSGKHGILNSGELAQASFTDIDITEAMRGMRLYPLDVTFDNVRVCDSTEWDFTIDTPAWYGSTYAGDLEASLVYGDASDHPGLVLSDCSDFNVVEVDGDVTILGPDGDNDNDDGPDVVEYESEYAVLTSG